MDYNTCLIAHNHGCVSIDSSTDDHIFAQMVATALRKYTDPPARVPLMSLALQGNLCEFCVWEIGHTHWKTYSADCTWPANADGPWRDHSDAGIDILALAGSADNPVLIIVEVKSSGGDGRDLIFGGSSSLRTDFEHLFSGNVQHRLQNRVGDIWFDLAVRRGQRDLAEKVKQAVGDGPCSCQDIRLTGVLVSAKGADNHRATRSTAFDRLKSHLVAEGWKDSQIAFRSIEVADFATWLDEVVRRSTNAFS